MGKKTFDDLKKNEKHVDAAVVLASMEDAAKECESALIAFFSQVCNEKVEVDEIQDRIKKMSDDVFPPLRRDGVKGELHPRSSRHTVEEAATLLRILRRNPEEYKEHLSSWTRATLKNRYVEWHNVVLHLRERTKWILETKATK